MYAVRINKLFLRWNDGTWFRCCRHIVDAQTFESETEASRVADLFGGKIFCISI